MGGPQQPYLYDPPPRRSRLAKDDPSQHGFNPKAVTQASWTPKPPPKPKPEGPLIDFNRHPDSYLILPYGNTGAKPMDPKIKGRIIWVRWLQFAFRIAQLVSALGMLVCVICVKGTQASEGWIIRIPPAVDIVTGLYALYHLCRAAKGRTPASSASYHFFAMVIDAGLIPFYVFTALLASQNAAEEVGTEGRWRSFFKADDGTTTLLQATFYIAAVAGGLHLISLLVDLYLVVIFRKIARLPPDMNPLEDNLTTRGPRRPIRGSHKHKTSSMTD
ncbi:hypothetical protein BDY21DRAFT_306115, partial [Lineolata rhizophorae]